MYFNYVSKTPKVLQIYDTIALAAKEDNYDASGINKVCRGKNNADGFIWKYDGE